jgi:hypothetical protein
MVACFFKIAWLECSFTHDFFRNINKPVASEPPVLPQLFCKDSEKSDREF